MLVAASTSVVPRDPRNVDLLLLQLIGWLFLDILSFLDHLRDPTRYRLDGLGLHRGRGARRLRCSSGRFDEARSGRA